MQLNETETAQHLFPIQVTDPRTLALECGSIEELESVFLAKDGLRPILDTIETLARNLVADPLTLAGRKQYVDMADSVKKASRTIDKVRKNLVDDLKDKPKRIDAGAKVAKDYLDALAEDIRAPVTAIENREAALELFANRPNIMTAAPLAELEAELATAKAFDDSEAVWHEQHKAAQSLKLANVEAFAAMVEKKRQEEKDRAELEEFKRQQAEKKRQEELEEARKEGERRAAERMKAEAEQKAAAEAQAKKRAAEALAAEEQAKAQQFRNTEFAKAQAAPKPQADKAAEAYEDIKATIKAAGFTDLSAAIIAAIKGGKIRHVHTTL